MDRRSTGVQDGDGDAPARAVVTPAVDFLAVLGVALVAAAATVVVL